MTDSPSSSKAVNQFLQSVRPMLIGGNWVESINHAVLNVINPATGLSFASVYAADADDVDRAVTAARAAFEGREWNGMTPTERGELLWRIADLIEENTDALAELTTLENGKPYLAAKNGDIPFAARTFRYYAGWSNKIEGHTPRLSVPGRQFHAYTQYEPVGVVGQIVPWNGPVTSASWKLAPALAAGCTSVFKPSEETPLTALKLGELFLEAGLPAGVVNIVPGLGETAGEAISRHRGIDKIAFTGSTEVGRKILHCAAGNLKKVSLELGGKSPMFVFADADLEQTVPGTAQAIFNNAGQVCIAGSRLYVEKVVYERVLQGIADIAENIRVGPGMSPDTEMGPLISARQLDRVSRYIDSGRAEGAELVTGGKRIGEQGYFLEPTVFANTTHEMKILREEIFGPVLSIMRVDELSDVKILANDTCYGLAASIWTKDIKRAHQFAADIKAGLLWINTHGIPDPAVPFGGYKQSGWGRELGWQGIEQYTELKAVITAL